MAKQQLYIFSEQDLAPENLQAVNSAPAGPVTCLGKEFENDEARRAYFREELRMKLPKLRHIEGFPIGEDDDIINLSDPPYYTACPNPWLNDFIQEWEQEKVQLAAEGKRSEDFEVKEPYAQAIHSRKNHPIYKTHSYHTKVPHDVIMKYLLHYTQPGDIVLDNFCGTGMTGVAANEVAFPSHYDFDKGKQWGYRNCILGDLSPFASYITYNYTHKVDKESFHNCAIKIYSQLYKELSWLYETKDSEDTKNVVNYYIWSEVQLCPNCNEEFTYWDVAVDFDNNIVKDEYACPHCGTLIKKAKSIKSVHTIFDESTGESYNQIKYVPVIVNYTKDRKRIERTVNQFDLDLYNKVLNYTNKAWFPTNKMMGLGEKWGDTWRAGYHIGFTHVHNFYTKRNLIILSRLFSLIQEYKNQPRVYAYLMAWFTSCQSRLHIMNRYAPKHHRHVGPLANTLYVSGTPTEISPFYFVKSKIEDNTIDIRDNMNVVNQVCSACQSLIKDSSIDYIFTDPPFGGNIMYSELNYIYESWIQLFTNNEDEAITSETQAKDVFAYQSLMTKSFHEYYRILKPGKWMTVEFSNTSASIWNAIRNSIQSAGFIILFVADLNKGRGGLHGIYSDVAVNQDLAITCLKPSTAMLNSFITNATSPENVWDFVGELLDHLPPHVGSGTKTNAIIERSPKILYDRLVAYYVQHGYSVPMSAIAFQQGLRERFIERDGMFFSASQAAEYDEAKKMAPEIIPMGIIISDEANGIQWLKNFLKDGPKTYSEVQPEWMQALNGIRKGDLIPELKDILQENFIEESNGQWRLPNIQDDIDKETLRTKSLLREFKRYVETASKPKARIKQARVEALRAGFKDCYVKKDFQTIVTVGDKIPQNLRDEDEVLLQFYDIALNKL